MLGSVLHSEQADSQIGEVIMVRGIFFNDKKAPDAELEARLQDCVNCIPLGYAFTKDPLSSTQKETILIKLKEAVVLYIQRKGIFFAKAKLKKEQTLQQAQMMFRDYDKLESVLNHFNRYDFFEPTLELMPLVHFFEEILEKIEQLKVSAKAANTFKTILTNLYTQLGIAQVRLKNTQEGRSFLDNAMNELEEVLPEQKKTPWYAKIKSYIYNHLVKVEIQANHLQWASKMLEVAQKNDPNSHHGVINSVKLSEAWATAGDFRNAYYWRNKALSYYQTLRVTNYFQELDKFKAERPVHTQKVQEYLQAHYQQLEGLLKQSAFAFKMDKEKQEVELSVDLPKIVPSIKRMLAKASFPIEITLNNNSITLKPSSLFGCKELKNLLKILKAMAEKKAAFRAELEAQRLRMVQMTLAEESTPKASLTMQEPPKIIEEPSAPTALSSSQPNSEPTLAPTLSVEPKSVIAPTYQTHLQKAQEALKAVTEPPPQTDCARLGFSEEVFGEAKFYQCRSRGENRPYYVVFKSIEGKENPPQEVIDDFIKNRFPNAKIVPLFGEQGFKWLQYNKQVGKEKSHPILFCKNDSGWRMFPVAFQANKRGEVAFLYGEFQHTKNGSWNKQVKEYGIPIKKIKTNP